jgi:hypothetical protein
MNERYKEIIKYHTEILKVMFVVFFADITGIVSLIKKGTLTSNEWKLFFAGILVIFAVFIVTYKLDRKITSGIKKLR